MKLFVLNKNGLALPVQANEGEDAAYDICATSGPTIFGTKIERPIDGMPMWSNISFIEYRTNLFIAPENEQTRRPTSFRVDASGAFCGVDWEDILIKYHIVAHPRSSISKYNLALANSVAIIDNGYRGEMLVRFKYIFQPEDLILVQEYSPRIYGAVNNEKVYQIGDKIIQIKASPNIPIRFEKVQVLPPSNRGVGGWGSSGK